jgi:hypothetical protein
VASGGARPRSGPAPDPNALRRDRPSDAAEWTTLPAERTGPIPDWPLFIKPSPAEQAHWDALWRKPQAVQWEAHGQEVEVALYVRSLAEAEIPGAASNLRTEVRRTQENLGLSYVGLLKYRWRIADPAQFTPAATAASTPSAARPARRGTSSRERFRVVKPVEDS